MIRHKQNIAALKQQQKQVETRGARDHTVAKVINNCFTPRIFVPVCFEYLCMRNFSVFFYLFTLFLEEFDYTARVQHALLQLSRSIIGQHLTM